MDDREKSVSRDVLNSSRVATSGTARAAHAPSVQTAFSRFFAKPRRGGKSAEQIDKVSGRHSPLLARKKHTATEALVGLFTVVLGAAVVTALYFARELLVPLALAALLTFVLAPLVTRFEHRIGRVAAVTCVTILVFCGLATLTWVATRQAFDLVTQLPNYRTNIDNKLHAFEVSKDGKLKRFSQMLTDLEAEIPVFGRAKIPSESSTPKGRAKEVVIVPASEAPVASNPLSGLQLFVVPFLRALATCGVVIVLVIFMLLKREDLRSRLIKIVGQGRISTTSRAMEDAAARVARYLTTQLLVNIAFGAAVTAGFYLIGLPNALLWGSLAAVLRFIPYVGAPVAAICPVLLGLAISPGWEMVIYTLALFAVLELATGNLLEPLLYRSSTGVSSLALIVAAIFWTWLWGPIGLLLSTPLTVCLAVLGRHVPRLSFFSVLLGNEEALTPAEECYHRLLVGGLNEAGTVVDAYIHSKSLTALYDNVLVPAVTTAEMDFQREELEEIQRDRVLQGVRDIIEDLSSRPVPESKIDADKSITAEPLAAFPKFDCRVICVSTRGARDEVAGAMLVHLLQQQGFEAAVAISTLSIAQLIDSMDEFKADACCISVVAPTTLIHARHLCSKLRARSQKLQIVVGIWGATENLEDVVKGLQSSGANEVVVSVAEAVVQFVKFSSSLGDQATGAKVPPDDEERIAAVTGLESYALRSNPIFDRMTKKLTKTFGVPIALLTLIDRDRQHFKSEFGLPEELSGICEIPRSDSVCNHMIADDAPLVVEDLLRDRRFSKNPIFLKNGLRFYAGVPLHAADGQPVGALCLLDTKPRRFSEADQRLLKILGEEISENLLPKGAASLPDSALVG